MAFVTSFHNHIYRLFKRCFASLSTLLPPSASDHTYMTVSAFSDKYKCFRIQGIITPCKVQMQPKVLIMFGYKYKQLHKLLNSSCRSLHMQSRYHSTCIFSKDRPYKTHCARLNLSRKISPGLNDFIVRAYHGSPKFTIKNPLYSSYLESLVEEYDTLSNSQHNSSYTELQQQQLLRLNFLRPAVEVIKRIQEKQSEIQELAAVTDGDSDKEMKKLMDKEIEKCKEVIEELQLELVDVLVGEDPADCSDIVLEVSAGVGGQEAMLFATEVLNMYLSYAHYKGWTVTGLDTDMSDIGGMRKGIAEISGQDVYKHLKYEVGVHRVQRIPKTEKAGRIHTSTISVAVLPQPREIDIDIQQKDLKIETFRNSGPGGQSVNTTDSAVRITHIPTGTVSECKKERSQIKNKEFALKNLKNKMYQVMLEEQEAKRRATRKMQMGTRARSEKIRTYNFHQDRITDHRLKDNCSDLAVFMIGGERLENLISSLTDVDKLHTLESMLEEYETELIRKKSGKS